MRMRTAFIGAVVVAALGLGFGGTAVAEPTGAPAQAASVKYSDEDVVGLLVFGAGPAAQDRPELAAKFQNSNTELATPEVIADATSQLRAADPDFHEEVTVNSQSGDAIKAESALSRITTDIKSISDQSASDPARARLNGPVKTQVTFVQTVSVVTTVVGAAEAVGIVILLYQFDHNGSNLDRQNLVASVTESL